jgi:hypothetical protein
VHLERSVQTKLHFRLSQESCSENLNEKTRVQSNFKWHQILTNALKLKWITCSIVFLFFPFSPVTPLCSFTTLQLSPVILRNVRILKAN